MSSFPTETEILALNGRVAALLDRPPGVRDVKLLRAIMLGVRICRGGASGAGDEFQRAAGLLHQIVSLSPFTSVNAATGLAASLLYLERHGHRPAFGSGQAASLIAGVENGTLGQDRIASMFRLKVGRTAGTPRPPTLPAAGSRAG